MHPCHNYHCGNCENTSPELWPHLNYTLEYYNGNDFGVAVSWEQPGMTASQLVFLTRPSDFIITLPTVNRGIGQKNPVIYVTAIKYRFCNWSSCIFFSWSHGVCATADP